MTQHPGIPVIFGSTRIAPLAILTLRPTPKTRECDFASDIGYALWRESLARGKRKLGLEDCRILEHLRLSNVELSRKPAGTLKAAGLQIFGELTLPPPPGFLRLRVRVLQALRTRPSQPE